MKKFLKIELVGLGWEGENTDLVYLELKKKITNWIRTEKSSFLGVAKNITLGISVQLDNIHSVDEKEEKIILKNY